MRVACVYERHRTGSAANCWRTQVFFGIATRWGMELETAMPNLSGDHPEEAPAELGVSVKYLLRRPSARGPALAVALAAGFAVGNRTASEQGRVELQPSFAFLQPIGRTTLQGNVGYAVTPGGEHTEQRAVYNLSLAIPYRERWHGFAELAGSTGNGPPELAISPGVKYGFGQGHFIALGFPLGLTSSSPRFAATFQVQFALRKAHEGTDTR